MSAYPRARSEGIVTEELGDETLVYDGATETAHALSKDAASVWMRCDGHSSAQDIARRLGLDEARVAQALDDLSAAELIEEPDGISRRALYQRAAKLGTAALSASLIYSIAVPAANASISSNCGPAFGTNCDLVFTSGNCSGSSSSDDVCKSTGGPSCGCHVETCVPQSGGGSVGFGTCI
jgi:hypothetical protein